MLDTAFFKQPELSKSRLRALSKGQMKTWSYVGRFMWGFAQIEYQVNQLFYELLGGDLVNQDVASGKQRHGLGFAASLLLTYTLDLRKKVNLIEIILQSRGIDESATFKRVHALHDLRNVMAHWPFEGDQSGIECDYVDAYGNFG